VTEKLRESQLYEPVRQYWTAAGYQVRGEVCCCDVLACLNDELIAIELKTSLNLEVILQAAERQKQCTQVWIAVPKPGGRSLRSKRWRQAMHLLKRLELGLLLVDLDQLPAGIDIVLICLPFDRSASQSRARPARKKMREEFDRRHGDHNIGGISRTRLMTAYREQALLIAALLSRAETASAAQLCSQGSNSQTYSILRNNHYGWFEKRGPGQYFLTEAGHMALQKHHDLVGQLVAELPGSTSHLEL
jgi:hypothetical protein